MKITVQMFADCLDKYLINKEIVKGNNVGYESIALLLPDEYSLKPDKAYVIDSPQLCKLADVYPSCLIISTEGNIPDLPCSVLTCSGTLSEVYEAAQEAVERYSKLEEKLNEGLLNDEGIEYFLKECAVFFGNLIQVLDPALNVIAGISPIYEGEDEWPSSFEEKNTGFSVELVSEMAKRNLLRQTFEFKSAQYFKTQLFLNGAIHLNIFDEDKYIGKLLIIENITPFKPGVSDIVNIVGKYFKHLLIKRSPVINANLFTAEYFVSEILSGRVKDTSFVSDQLSSIGWKIHDTYCVFYIQINSRDLLDYYAQSLSYRLSNTLIFPLEDGLAIVLNMGSKDSQVRDVQDYISQFLLRSRLYCGYSEKFDDFLSADSYFQQAKSAALLGKKSDPNQHIFNYSDFAMQQFVSAAISMKFERTFIPSAIHKILEYDTVNGTDYYNTLKVYLENGTNQVTTAKKLHIHRNSLKYRLTRLKEIADVNLNNLDQQLRFILSYRLIEFKN